MFDNKLDKWRPAPELSVFLLLLEPGEDARDARQYLLIAPDFAKADD